MNPSRPFIERPVATTLLMVAVFLTGLLAYRLLPVAALPQVDYPTIQVVTPYPGASPDVITSSITAPLERQFGQLPGLAQMSSTSSGGASVITLQFGLETALDVAEQEVQAAINAGSNLLPTDLPSPPVYNKVNPADAPIMTLAVSSPSMNMTKLADMVDSRISPKISQVSGVGLVSVSGGQKPAVRLTVNADALASRGLTLEDVRTSINQANINQAKGSFDGPKQNATLDGNDQLKSPKDYLDLVIAFVKGAPVRLGDVAVARQGAENAYLAAWADRSPAILLNIQKQPGANVIEVADKIKALLPELKNTLPGAVDVTILSDRTETIRASVEDVEIELGLAIVLVVAVIFVFLRSVPATLIPGVAVILSLIGTFGVMYLLGFSINNLTLMALTIATGFVVDDAIVMIENIARYIEEGEDPMTAALKGSEEIGFTIISLTFSLIAVLIPLLFMGDVVGRLFREFAVTLAVSILISAAISLSLTPMMSARLLRHEREEDLHPFHRATHRFFDNVISGYGKLLQVVLRHQGLTLLVALGTVAATALLYTAIPKSFFPLQDTGAIQVVTEAPQTVSFEEMARRQQEVTDLVLKDPAVKSASSFIGVDGNNATLNTGRIQIILKPKEERGDLQHILNRLQETTRHLPGMSVYMQPVQDLTIDARASRAQYQFTLQSPNLEDLTEWSPKLVSRLSQLPELKDVTSDLQDNGLQAFVNINRDAAARLGVTPAAVDNALYNAYGQRLISTIFTQSNQYRVVLELDRSDADRPISLEGLYVPTATGGPVPLSTIASLEKRRGLLAVNHLGQFPTATLSFNLAPNAALGEAVKAIKAAQAELGVPSQIQVTFQGAALAFEASLTNTLWLILAAIVTMYIVLGVLYESFIHPVTILSTLPSAGIGALLALLVFQTPLGMIGIIGIILLIGIVKKNAIMMIDFALDAERNEGMTPHDAIYQACLLRFRPILMTTLCALLGAIPLMIGQGMGSELRFPLGVTMVGGLLVSQVLTLFTTPVIYLAFSDLSKRFAKPTAAEVAP